MDPRSTSPGSNMPSYKWLEEGKIDTKLARPKLALMQKLGVPYSNDEIDGAEAAERAQAEAVVTDLVSQGIAVRWDSEVVALISYLQRLGRDVGVKPIGRDGAPVAAGQPHPQEGAR
jgi:cytochrome c oxidase cbb3-type subunit I/II